MKEKRGGAEAARRGEREFNEVEGPREAENMNIPLILYHMQWNYNKPIHINPHSPRPTPLMHYTHGHHCIRTV